MENKKTEKFALLNLIRTLSGQCEQSPDDGKHSEEETLQTVNTQPAEKEAANTARHNVLAGVIERHEKISYRLKNNKRNNGK